MTQFEKITESPEVLGKFLASLPVIDGPWDAEFHKRFCDYCQEENCDNCKCNELRNNPCWWLTLTDTPEPSEETKRAAKKLAALVDQYSAAEAGRMLEISMQALEILKEEKITGYGWATAIHIAKAIGIHERGGQESEPGTVVVDLEPAEFERELSPEEREEMKRLRHMFRYFMGKDLETGEIEIGSMDGENRIVFKGTEEARWFMKNLKELIQESTIHG